MTTDQVGPETRNLVNEADTNRLLSLFSESDEVWNVFINGANGPAVDVFFCLPLALRGGVLFCGNQRKFSSASLSGQRATELLQSIRAQVPRCLPAGSVVVAGHFIMFPSFNVDEDGLPNDSFVVSFHEHPFYHGSLAFHPASSPCIDVNGCSDTMLRQLQSIARKAENIVTNRPFASLAAFEKFCGKLSAEDAERVIFYG